MTSGDVDKGGARGATAPPLGAIFALKYLKNMAKLGKNERKLSIRPPPPLVAKVKIAPPLEGVVSTCL